MLEQHGSAPRQSHTHNAWVASGVPQVAMWNYNDICSQTLKLKIEPNRGKPFNDPVLLPFVKSDLANVSRTKPRNKTAINLTHLDFQAEPDKA